ncbi:MAG TPA: group 1 truncated hemoglobin [Ornithinibacter sp.]|nr:group 1 truncated hemoglobin [Ornithinibacter sp.]
MASDFERIGGAPAVAAVVDELYKRVTTDPLVGHYFEGIDLPRLKRHMVLMLTSVLGGPDDYDGRPLDEAHQPLGITDEDYARVGEHLMAILAEAGAPEDVQGDVAGVLGAVRPQVVSKD